MVYMTLIAATLAAILVLERLKNIWEPNEEKNDNEEMVTPKSPIGDFDAISRDIDALVEANYFDPKWEFVHLDIKKEFSQRGSYGVEIVVRSHGKCEIRTVLVKSRKVHSLIPKREENKIDTSTAKKKPPKAKTEKDVAAEWLNKNIEDIRKKIEENRCALIGEELLPKGSTKAIEIIVENLIDKEGLSARYIAGNGIEAEEIAA